MRELFNRPMGIKIRQEGSPGWCFAPRINGSFFGFRNIELWEQDFHSTSKRDGHCPGRIPRNITGRINAWINLSLPLSPWIHWPHASRNIVIANALSLLCISHVFKYFTTLHFACLTLSPTDNYSFLSHWTACASVIWFYRLKYLKQSHVCQFWFFSHLTWTHVELCSELWYDRLAVHIHANHGLFMLASTGSVYVGLT